MTLTMSVEANKKGKVLDKEILVDCHHPFGNNDTIVYQDFFALRSEQLKKTVNQDEIYIDPSIENWTRLVKKHQLYTGKVVGCRDLSRAKDTLWQEFMRYNGYFEVDTLVTHYELTMRLVDSSIYPFAKDINASSSLPVKLGGYQLMYFFNGATVHEGYKSKTPFVTFNVQNESEFLKDGFSADYLVSKEFVIKYGFENLLKLLERNYGVQYNILQKIQKRPGKYISRDFEPDYNDYLPCKRNKYKCRFVTHEFLEPNEDLFNYKRDYVPKVVFCSGMDLGNIHPEGVVKVLENKMRKIHNVCFDKIENMPDHNVDVYIDLLPIINGTKEEAIQYLLDTYGIELTKID